MKIRNLTAIAAIMASFFSTHAQEIEYDDMYFNSKDRKALNDRKASASYAYAESGKKVNGSKEVASKGNPTDSYSSKNINPEYISRSNAQTAKEDEQDYFINDDRYKSGIYYNNWNNNYNNWAANFGYNNSWYSPYYGYGARSNPWCDPLYSNSYYSPYNNYGWGSYYGSSWGYSGWGMSYAWGSPYYYPRNYWRPYGGYGYGGYGNTVIVVNNDNTKGPVYGKRNSRSSYVIRNTSGTGRTAQSNGYTSGDGRTYTGGRIKDSGKSAVNNSQNSSTRDVYYNRSWRRTENNNNSSNKTNNSGRSSSYYDDNDNRSNSGSTYTNPSRNSWNTGSGNNNNNSGSKSSGSYNSGSRSSWSNGGSSGSRSSGSSSGGSSSPSRSSRGR